jgi:hypothetical protein
MDKSLVERLKYQNLQESNVDGRTVFKTILRVIDKGAIYFGFVHVLLTMYLLHNEQNIQFEETSHTRDS